MVAVTGEIADLDFGNGRRILDVALGFLGGHGHGLAFRWPESSRFGGHCNDAQGATKTPRLRGRGAAEISASNRFAESGESQSAKADMRYLRVKPFESVTRSFT